MSLRIKLLWSAAAALLFAATVFSQAQLRPAHAVAHNGVVQVPSAYPLAETVARLKADVAAKGIMLFAEIDQARLAADAGVALRPSTLLIFGNPGLGAQFMTSNPASGIDWPVRLLVYEDAAGKVWAVYSDFGYIARRHHIADREAQFAMASQVIASIISVVRGE